MGQPAQHAVGSAGDQFYVTHCTTSDSVLNNPGYTVRAASATDPDTLDAAFRYPPYELPIEMWRDLPPVALAPRRLARTVNPDGGVWVVHSSYLAKDTVDRDRSYFSHLLLLNSADPAAVLRSWGADGWMKSYPQGAPKSLPGNAKLPVGSLVNDATLTAFLSDSPPGPLELSTTVCPDRLRASAEERRDLFARVLQALLLLAVEEDEHRRRLYVHAEPGVVAMLLYGALRLLPQTVTDNLTFSTFEPYHRNIRDYKLAEVIGTYIGPPEHGKGLDTDLSTTRGIAVDTIVPSRSSPELRRPLAESLPAGVDELIELAAQGEWKLLPSVRHAIGADPDGLPRAGKAITRARALARIDAGEASIDELLAVQSDPLAADELKTRTERVWPVVKAAGLDPHRADVRHAFQTLFADADHIKEVWEEAVEAILKEDFRNWDTRWTIIRETAGLTEARKVLNKLVGSEKNEGKLSKLPTDIRARMRSACGDVGLLPPRALLVPIGLGELEPLLTSQPEWAGYTAFVLMAKDELNWIGHIPAANRLAMRKRAKDFLFSAPPGALASYVHAARPFLDTDPSFLAMLFTPFSPSATKLMDKLLTTTTLEPGDWMKLCTFVGLTQDDWGAFLLEKERLANLLVGLGGDGIGKDVWRGYLDALTPAVVAPELIEVGEGDDPQVIHDWERKVHAHLRTAAERLTSAGVKLAPALPEGGVGKLFAANNLLKWTEHPELAERDGPDEVKHACAAYAIDPLHLVEVVYRKGGYDQLNPAEDPQSFAPLIALFKTCFPVDHVFNTAGRATREVIRLSRACPKHLRGAFQVRLLHACVWEVHYRAILTADWKEPLEPDAIAWLSQQVNKPAAKKPGQKASAAPSPMEAVEVPEEEQGDGELPEPDEVATSKTTKKKATGKKGKSGGYGSSGRRKADDSRRIGVIVGLVVLIAVIIGGIVFALKFANKKENSSEPPSEKTAPKKDPPKTDPKK